MTNFIIDVVSDPVCPWCYIGKKRLDKAIALYQKVYPSGRSDTFTVNWAAYYLDASAPSKGIPYHERMLQKLASTASLRSKSTNATNDPDPNSNEEDIDALAARLTARLASIGRQEGIAFSFAGKIGSTRSAHRAISYSRTRSAPNRPSNPQTSSPGEEPTQLQDRFVTALFEAYFEGSIDITSHADLADVGARAGLDRADLLAWLDSGAGGEEVDDEDRAARARGVKGVPCFTVQGARLDGAQDVQDFLELFVKVKEEEKGKEEEEERRV